VVLGLVIVAVGQVGGMALSRVVLIGRLLTLAVASRRCCTAASSP
jgi:hypothetical protein